jgi:site-specific DNA recombinase
MKKCYLYCRKSSEDRNKQVQSIEDQKKVMKEFTLNHSLVIERTFQDEKSARKPFQRKGFDQLINALKKGLSKIVLTWKIDRLTRNPEESGIIQGMLQRGQIEKIITSDRTYYPEDNALLFSLEGAMANQYVRDLSKNVKRGMKSKVEKGVYPAFAPIGYLNSGIRKGEKTIDIDPINFPKLKALWDMLIARKYQLSDLYRIMEKQYPICGKTGRIVSFSTFHRTFRNPFYCGLFRWGGRLHVGTHKKMLTKSQFDFVQDFLRKKPKTRLAKNHFEYRGVFRCGTCGSAITADRIKKFIKTKGITKGFNYYKCPHHKKGIKCEEKPMSKTLIEKQLVRCLERVSIPQEVLDYGVEYLNCRSNQVVDIDNQLKEFDRRISETEKRIKIVTNNLVLETDADCRLLMKDKLLQFRLELHQYKEDKQTIENRTTEMFQEMRTSLQTVSNAKLILKEGIREDKIRLMNAIGSNWNIRRKRVRCTPNVLFQALLTCKKRGMFQPKKASNTLDNETFIECNVIWRTVRELIHNYLNS